MAEELSILLMEDGDALLFEDGSQIELDRIIVPVQPPINIGGNTPCRTACCATHDLSQASLLACVGVGSPFYKMLQRLDASQWSVLSFDNNKKSACVQIDSEYGSRFFTVNIR